MLNHIKKLGVLLLVTIATSPGSSQVTDSYIQVRTGISSFDHLRSDGFYSIRPDFPTTENYECLGAVVGSDWSLLSFVERGPNAHFFIGDFFSFRAGMGKQFNHVNGKGSVETGNIYQGYTGMSGPAEDVSSMWYVIHVSLGLQTSYRISDDYSFGLRYYYRAEGDVLRAVTTQDEIWAMGIFGNVGRYSGRLDWKYKQGSVDSQFIHYFSCTFRRGFGKDNHEYFGITLDHFSSFIPETNDVNPNINVNNFGSNTELSFSFGFSLN